MKSFFVLMISLFTAQAGAQSEAAVKCALEICGSKDFLLNTNGVGSFRETRSQDVKALIKRSLPVMEQIMDAETEYNRMKLRTLENFGTMFTPDSMNDTERAMLGMLAILSFDFSDLDASYLRTQNGVNKIHRPKLNQKLAGLEPAKQAWIADVMDAMMASDWTSVSNNLENRPFEFVLRILGFEPSQAMELGQMALATATATRPQLGRRSIQDSELEIFGKLAMGLELNSFEKKAFVSALSTLYSQQNIIRGAARAVAIRNPFTMAEILDLNQKKLSGFKSILASPEKLRSLRTKVIDSCSAQIASSVASAATPEQLKLAMQVSEAVKASALKTVPLYLTGEPLQSARTALQKAHFMPPLDRPTVIKNIEQYFLSAAADGKALIDYKSFSDAKTERSDLMLQMIHIINWDTSEGEERGVFRLLTDTCAEIEPPGVTDAVLTSSGSIVIGWQSALWPEYGAGVMAHELGHVVEKAVVMERDLKDNLTCQAKQHTFVYGAGATSDNHAEDFADNFSLSVQRELRKSWPYTKNFGCLLQGIDTETRDYQKDAFSLAEDSTEGHSSGFFRLLQQEAGRGGKLPASCADLPELKGKAFAACAK